MEGRALSRPKFRDDTDELPAPIPKPPAFCAVVPPPYRPVFLARARPHNNEALHHRDLMEGRALSRPKFRDDTDELPAPIPKLPAFCAVVPPA